MNKVTLKLSDDLLQQLTEESERLNEPLEGVIDRAIRYFLADNEPTDEEILAMIRQSMVEALAGKARPVDEVLAELKQEFNFDADES